MKRRMSRGALLGVLLVVAAGCSLQALPLQGPAALPALATLAQVPALMGIALGSDARLPACTGARTLATACLFKPGAGNSDGVLGLQLPAHGLPRGLSRQGSALQLGQRLESISLALDGALALEALPARLTQLCGQPGYDSRLEIDGRGYLRALAWRCPQADVQFNAVLHDGQVQGALNLTTARGQAWFDQQDALTVATPPRY
jgi:hypothetical protein